MTTEAIIWMAAGIGLMGVILAVVFICASVWAMMTWNN